MTGGALVPDVDRIAVLRANGLGDLIVAEPALTALRAAYPRAQITLLGAAPAQALLHQRPFPVDRVVEVPPVPGVRIADERPDASAVAVEDFCAAIRAERFDLAVQLHGGGGNANPLLRRLGARITAGSRAPGAAPLDRSVIYTEFQHDALRWLEVVGLVGAAPQRLTPRLTVTAADRAEAADALCATDADVPLVALHPGASEGRRRWSAERLAAVGDALAAAGAQLVLLAGSGERAVASQVRTALRAPAVDLTGAVSLSGMIGVLERATLFVGNDSGPRHLAEAVGTATVAVFTKWNLVDVAPLFRARHRVLVSWATACAQCGTDVFTADCGHGATCLGDVPTSDVIDAAVALLASETSACRAEAPRCAEFDAGR